MRTPRQVIAHLIVSESEEPLPRGRSNGAVIHQLERSNGYYLGDQFVPFDPTTYLSYCRGNSLKKWIVLFVGDGQNKTRWKLEAKAGSLYAVKEEEPSVCEVASFKRVIHIETGTEHGVDQKRSIKITDKEGNVYTIHFTESAFTAIDLLSFTNIAFGHLTIEGDWIQAIRKEKGIFVGSSKLDIGTFRIYDNNWRQLEERISVKSVVNPKSIVITLTNRVRPRDTVVHRNDTWVPTQNQYVRVNDRKEVMRIVDYDAVEEAFFLVVADSARRRRNTSDDDIAKNLDAVPYPIQAISPFELSVR